MPDLEHRCVHCGLPKSDHKPSEANLHTCRNGRTVFATMALPDGYTCKDCQYFAGFCKEFLSRFGHENSCDWYPSRFITIQPKVQK